jgi:large subunit ribosomal protein L5
MKELYKNTVVDQLKKELGHKNVMSVPGLTKVNVNVGIGSYVRNSGEKGYDEVVENISLLTGQKPVVVLARIAVSNFRLREGQPVGVATTLRGNKMYEFVNKMVHIVFPRIRDFRGLSVKGFDGKGNYSIGIKEVNVFPEVNPENMGRNHGLQITIGTSATNDRDGYLLLKALGVPFKDEVKEKASTN